MNIEIYKNYIDQKIKIKKKSHKYKKYLLRRHGQGKE